MSFHVLVLNWIWLISFDPKRWLLKYRSFSDYVIYIIIYIIYIYVDMHLWFGSNRSSRVNQRPCECSSALKLGSPASACGSGHGPKLRRPFMSFPGWDKTLGEQTQPCTPPKSSCCVLFGRCRLISRCSCRVRSGLSGLTSLWLDSFDLNWRTERVGMDLETQKKCQDMTRLDCLEPNYEANHVHHRSVLLQIRLSSLVSVVAGFMALDLA